MSAEVRVFPNTYVDSVVQMSATRAMRALEGVDWAAAGMATEANLQTLAGEGFATSDLGSANDLVLAARGERDETVRAALDAGEDAMFADRSRPAGPSRERAPRSIARAVREHPDTNVAIVSVPGQYAALEAHEALSAGLDVLLFSDNVPVADEVALKQRAVRLGRFVMGPGAGTAMLGGTGLGFANIVEPGPVGIVAAAGTGAQEAMSLLDRWGAGISCVIGLGGRDLSDAVDGRMAKVALASLSHDPATGVIFLVSKPPADRVARELLGGVAGALPVVATLVGQQNTGGLTAEVPQARTLEAGALLVLDELGLPRPDVVGALADRVVAVTDRLPGRRNLIRGLFSGGTLCYESQVVLADTVGPVYSNVPLQGALREPAPPGSHLCLDLGEEEYTVGRPHPMIDPQARVELIDEHGRDPAVAVILLDVVLGMGAHEDPAGQLAPACARAVEHGVAVVAYVLGTRQDPQGYDQQRRTLEDAGCIVPETSARAALAAGAIAVRDPALVRRAT